MLTFLSIAARCAGFRKKFFFAPRLGSKKMPKNPISSVEYLRR